jgi:hypothetical protein
MGFPARGAPVHTGQVVGAHGLRLAVESALPVATRGEQVREGYSLRRYGSRGLPANLRSLRNGGAIAGEDREMELDGVGNPKTK